MYPSLTGFPFNLLWVILLGFLIRPKTNGFLWAITGAGFAAIGLFLPLPHSVMFWFPSGPSNIVLSAAIVGYALTTDRWFIKKNGEQKKVFLFPDRRQIRENLMKIESIEERQHEYVNIVQRVAQAIEMNDQAFINTNTVFFLLSFAVVFGLNFAGIVYIDISQPAALKDIYKKLYDMANSMVHIPQSLDEAFADFIRYGAVRLFSYYILFFFLVLSIMGRIFDYRKVRRPLIGNPMYFHLPVFSVWISIASGLIYLLVLHYKIEGPLLFVTENFFLIFMILLVFQGISIFWVYLQVRLLPAGAIVAALILSAFFFQSFAFIVLGFFLVLGLLDFWFEFRKKALHPRLFSDGV